MPPSEMDALSSSETLGEPHDDLTSSEKRTFSYVLSAELRGFSFSASKAIYQHGKRSMPEAHPNSDPEVVYKSALSAALTGLAFSGGGIRSATFNLGLIQALCKKGLLSRFDYLSTVSGGGYIGTWLSALVRRMAGGNIERAESAIATAGRLAPAEAKVNKAGITPQYKKSSNASPQEPPENIDLPDEVRAARALFFLRQYSNYLSPKKRIFSGDSLGALGTYLRNVLINQMILVFLIGSLMTLPYILAWYGQQIATVEHTGWYGLGLLSIAAIIMGVCIWANPRNSNNRSVDRLWTAQRSMVGFAIALMLIGIWFETAFLFGIWRLALPYSTSSEVPMWLTHSAWYTVAYVFLWLIGNAAAFIIHLCSRQSNSTQAWPGLKNAGRVLPFAILAGFGGGIVSYLAIQSIKLWLVESSHSPFLLWVVGGIAFPILVSCVWLTLTLHIALASEMFLETRREWWARVSGIVFASIAFWTLMVSLTILAPSVMSWGKWSIAAAGTGWVGTTVGGILLGKSKFTSAVNSPSKMHLLSRLAPPIFILGFLFLMAFAVHALYSAIGHNVWNYSPDECIRSVLEDSQRTALGSSFKDFATQTACEVTPIVSNEFSHIAIVGAALAGLGIILGMRASINLFSLNNFYGNRLTRCYIGASTKFRDPNPFTGFSTQDRVPLSDLSKAPDGSDHRAIQRPMIIVNAALNLVAGKELAWQERKAAPFTFTPFFCGFALPPTTKITAAGGFWPTASYTGYEGPSLGSVMAVSGAAASPNMGYHSSPAMGFLLTVFNVRLGRWYPNPETGKISTITQSAPKSGWWYLFRELFGMTDEVSNFIYLSDGGHFENLGVYELVRRRCKLIVSSDVGHDPNYSFEDLGNAIRRCRSDLGAEIIINIDPIRISKDTGYSSKSFAVGTIKYPEDPLDQPSGTIIYLKSSLTGNEPTELRQHKSNHVEFPQTPTSDQFFDESTFESYRQLGFFIGMQVADQINIVISREALNKA